MHARRTAAHVSVVEGTFQGFDVVLEPPGVALVTFRHEERLNAMSAGARQDLAIVLDRAQLDDAVRVVVFTGTGRGFVAGVNNRADAPEHPTLVPPIHVHRNV